MNDLNALTLPELFREVAGGDRLRRLLELARDEDLGDGGVPGDVTGRALLDPRGRCRADLVARAPGVVAGLECVPAVLSLFAPGSAFEALARDGDEVPAGAVLGRIEGGHAPVLSAERTLLNLVGRLSGVATRTRAFVRALHAGSGPGEPTPRAGLYDTRKTTPGLRGLEKYAVRCGGGFCHRTGLHDAMLIKDNHLAGVSDRDLRSFVARGVAKARGEKADLRFVEVEVDTLEQLSALLTGGAVLDPASGAGIDLVLLDNMTTDQLRRGVRVRDRLAPGVGLEASGGVTLDSVRAIGLTGVDRISVGSLTHGAASLDVALDVIGVGAGA